MTVTLLSSGVTRVARSLGGTVSATTDSTGLATFSGVTENQAGTYTLLAQAAGFVSATSNPFTIRAGGASAIQATAGTPQSATIGTAFTNALQATVTDSLGNPVSGVTVNFAAPGSGASAALSASSAVTDAGGHVTVNATANSIAGNVFGDGERNGCERHGCVRADQPRVGRGQSGLRAATGQHDSWSHHQCGHGEADRQRK